MTDLRSGILAEFDAGGPMAAAARRLHEDGFRVVGFTPYEVPGLADALGAGRTRLPRITLCAALAGALFAYAVQWYTNAFDYPLPVGGRPPHAALAFVPIVFETAVLFACCTGFVALFLLLGLPRLRHPVSEIDGFERASVDRFWVGVSRDDPRFDAERIAALLDACGPIRIVTVEPRP
jgi:hypothetical protein